jgi:sarcosine oxidase gamma subunit
VLNIPAEADHDPAKGETDVLGRVPGEFMVSARGRTLA